MRALEVLQETSVMNDDVTHVAVAIVVVLLVLAGVIGSWIPVLFALVMAVGVALG